MYVYNITLTMTLVLRYFDHIKCAKHSPRAAVDAASTGGLHLDHLPRTTAHQRGATHSVSFHMKILQSEQCVSAMHYIHLCMEVVKYY